MITEKKNLSMEKRNSPVSGYLIVVVVVAVIALGILAGISGAEALFVLAIIISLVLMPGFFFVNPNNSVVLLLFGEYKGTVKNNGFFWVNPFYAKKSISLRARNFDSDKFFFSVIICLIL